MGLFGKSHQPSQHLAIDIADDGFYAVSVSHADAGPPKVMLAMFQALEARPQEAVLEKFGKHLNIKQYRCTTLLEPGQYHLLSVDAPAVSSGEMKDAVRWSLKDMVDFPVDQATIDVALVPTAQAMGTRSQTLLAVAAKNSVIEQRQMLFVKAGIALTVIDIPDMAQRNISALLESSGRGVAMLSFNADGGLLTVTYGGQLYLSRRIDVSLTQLLNCSARPAPREDMRPADNLQSNYFDKITLELQRSLDHCDRQFHFIVFDKLLLAPIDLPALQAHLEVNMYLPVKMLDLNDIVDVSLVPQLSNLQQQQHFFLCLGAALRQEESAS
jgi:MSHA biogenesis protein MshI